MILIGGQFKGRHLKSPKGTATRPTTAILRKTVFDICREHVDHAHFLDLFAGSGAMGLEALSRGATHATFIDQDIHALRCLKENIALLKLEKQCNVIKGNALSLLKRLKGPFDIIYVDPPYGQIPLDELLLFFDTSTLLAEGDLLFLEEASPSSQHLDKVVLDRLIHKDTRKCGKSLLHQFTISYQS